MKGACAVALAIVLGALGLAAPIGCSSFESGAPPAGDAGRAEEPETATACSPNLASDRQNCGSCGNVCGAAQVCSGGACLAGCPDGIVRVAPDGDDGASGCEAGRAKKTIGAALAFARTAPAQTREIHVCAGTYREPPITLDVPVSILGGFGCSTFKRFDDYGPPTFNETSTTTLESDGPDTLSIAGPAVDASVRVDGMRIRGSVKNAAPTSAVLVRDGAKPVLSNLRVFGSAVPNLDFSSSGVRVTSGAAPEIASSRIEGGSGNGRASGGAGSVGVFIEAEAGAVRVHDCGIDGGSGRGVTLGSIGLVNMALSGTVTVERSNIVGGSGHTTGAAGPAAPVQTPVRGAASLGGGSFDFFDNHVHGGSGICEGEGDCQAIGLQAAVQLGPTTKTARVERNRVYGGDVSGMPAYLSLSYAVIASGGNGGTITNNLLHIGGAERTLVKQTAFGVAVGGGVDRLIAHNTIAAAPNAEALLFYIDAVDKEKSVRISDNLLLGTGVGVPVGVRVATCDGNTVTAVNRNFFVGFEQYAVQIYGGPECRLTGEWSKIGEAEAAIPSAHGNARIAFDCSTDSVAQCTNVGTCGPGYPNCLLSVVDEFDVAKFGTGNLSSDGWKPKGPVCAASARSLEFASTLPLDLLGRERKTPFTIGAHQGGGCP